MTAEHLPPRNVPPLILDIAGLKNVRTREGGYRNIASALVAYRDTNAVPLTGVIKQLVDRYVGREKITEERSLKPTEVPFVVEELMPESFRSASATAAFLYVALGMTPETAQDSLRPFFGDKPLDIEWMKDGIEFVELLQKRK